MASSSEQGARPNKKAKRPAQRQKLIRYKDRFASREHHQFYLNHYANCRIVVERIMVEDGVDPVFWNKLKARGWKTLRQVDINEINETLAREFCANIDTTDLEDGFVYLRGVEVPLTPEVINNIYGFPPFDSDIVDVLRDKKARGDNFYEEVKNIVAPNAPWSGSKSNPQLGLKLGDCESEDWKVYFRFINNRVYPKYANSALRYDEFAQFYALYHDIPVDVGRLHYAMLKDHDRDRKHVVILPQLITKLCRRYKVPEYRTDTRPSSILLIQRVADDDEPAVPPPEPEARRFPPQPQPQSGPQHPEQMSLSARDILRLHDRQRRFSQCTHDRNEALIHMMRCQHYGQPVADPQIFEPDHTQFQFPAEIEERMAQIRLEDGEEE